MSIYKRCSRCNKRLKIGEICSCYKGTVNKKYEAERQKEYDRNKRNKTSAAFYNSTLWQKLREQAKIYYIGIDIYSYYVLGKLEYGRIVHHIKPIKGYPKDKAKLSNLIFLTERNYQLIHNRIDNGEEKEVIKQLSELVRRWQEEFKKG